MKYIIFLTLGMLVLIACSDDTQTSKVSESDFDLSTVEGTCRYAMKLSEQHPESDPDYVRSITDMTCTTGDATREQWQCVVNMIKNGKAPSQADLDCFIES